MVLSKQQLIEVLQNEVRILIHLCGKVTPEMLDYRPTPKQRSTIELLRYLTIMGLVMVASIKAGSFLADDWNAAEKKAATLNFSAVLQQLEAQDSTYATAIGEISDADLQGEIELFGGKTKRGLSLVNLVVCGHAAYRAQLFCYLKACGRDELNTMNLWAGIDGPM